MTLRKGKLTLYLRIALSLVLLVALVRLAGTAQLTSAVAKASFGYMAIMFITINTDRVLVAYKWSLLLRAKGICPPLIGIVGACYRAAFWYNVFVPALGADAIRVYDISRQTGRSDDVISSVMVEHVISLLSILLVGLLGLTLFVISAGSANSTLLAQLILAFAVLLVIFTFSLNREWLASFLNRLAASRWRIVRKIETVLTSYQDYSAYRQALLMFLGLSIVKQFFPILMFFLVARALHLQIPVLTFLMFVPIITLVERLPISIGGFGVREATSVSLFSLAGVPQAEAFVIGFLGPVITKFAIAPFCLYFFLVNQPGQRSVPSRGSLSEGELERLT